MSTQRLPLVYILSPGHSGSTLLALLLGAHPELATVGELKVVPPHYRRNADCGCGSPMHECAFWRDIAARLAGQGHDLADPRFCTDVRQPKQLHERTIAAGVRGPLFETMRNSLISAHPQARELRDRMIECNVALISAIFDVTKRRTFVDASKTAFRLRYLLHSGRFAPKVLHLVRDGRAVAYSLIRKGHGPREAADDWVREHQQARQLFARWGSPETWKRVGYERLCESPHETLNDICRFIGIAAEQSLLEFRSWNSHVLGNRMRLSGDGQIRLDTKWKHELTGDALRVVESVTDSLNRDFGYV
jgi:hypothetical protein